MAEERRAVTQRKLGVAWVPEFPVRPSLAPQPLLLAHDLFAKEDEPALRPDPLLNLRIEEAGREISSGLDQGTSQDPPIENGVPGGVGEGLLRRVDSGVAAPVRPGGAEAFRSSIR